MCGGGGGESRRELKPAEVGSRQGKGGRPNRVKSRRYGGHGIANSGSHKEIGTAVFGGSSVDGYTGSIRQTGGYYTGWPGLRDLLEMFLTKSFCGFRCAYFMNSPMPKLSATGSAKKEENKALSDWVLLLLRLSLLNMY